MALHLPIGYRYVNPVPTSPLADNIAIAPSGLGVVSCYTCTGIKILVVVSILSGFYPCCCCCCLLLFDQLILINFEDNTGTPLANHQ